MKLIVGLGNPGKEYLGTRHNMGFDLVDFYLKEKQGDVSWMNKFNGLYYQTLIDGEKVIFLKPQSYMNLSGTVVREYINYFKISVEDILVISDDLDLNFGNYKIKENGSSGGHNGLKNIESNIQTTNYKRLKIGISKVEKGLTKDYVLGKLTSDEINIKNNLYKELVNVLDDYFIMNFSQLMSKYNRKNK